MEKGMRDEVSERKVGGKCYCSKGWKDGEAEWVADLV